MKFSYRFSNLMGTVYRKGNLTFLPDGNSIISPVGNRLSIFDLKNNKSETLPVESRYNITAMTISADGSLLIAVNEVGEAMLISLVSRSVLHYYNFRQPVHAISFSPDGSKFAVTKENSVLLFHAPGRTKEYNPFVLYRTFYGAYDETISIDWTTDSRAFCVGGKDMNTRVYGAQKFKNLIIYSVGGHTDSIINAFFEDKSLSTISVNGQLSVWKCDTELEALIPDTGDREDVQMDDSEEESEMKDKDQDKTTQMTVDPKEQMVLYRRAAKHNFREAKGGEPSLTVITSCAFHKPSHILVTGCSDGAFFMHEMPDFNLIHSLSISDQVIASVAFNKQGDWLALGCGGLGQLVVWEWQSESYVLKQQGHFNNMSCLEYSPDGQFIVTGGEDAKVKVWNTSNGFCFVTFSEHTGAITGVTFSQSGQVVVSCSLDGTVRAFDLNRYRNFRTFTSPRPVQFSCLALDPSGEVICAGGMDVFEIFVWSMQTGRLLEVLAGHEGPISSLSFSPAQAMMASASWDKTVKLWDVFENKGAKETLTINSDVVAVTFRPDGRELAISALSGQVSFWDIQSATQSASIEGRADLGYSRKETDKITAKKSSAAKCFSTLCYTADGKCILAGGQSKNICIYSIAEQILLKKFEITMNRSLDGTQELLGRRNMTEFGSIKLVEEGDDGQNVTLSLPGVKKGDLSSRRWKPEVRVSGVRFSPTGREWAATTTEGLLVYSLDSNLVFDPYNLDIDITPDNIKKSLIDEEYVTALMLAFRLNERHLIEEVVETIPPDNVSYVCGSLAPVYVDKLLSFVAGQLESSRHLEFYLRWSQSLLYQHGTALKQRAPNVMATLRSLQKGLTHKSEDLAKICDHNKYSLQYILSMAANKRKHPADGEEEHRSDSDTDSDASWDGLTAEMSLRHTAADSKNDTDEDSDSHDNDGDDGTEEEEEEEEEGEEEEVEDETNESESEQSEEQMSSS